MSNRKNTRPSLPYTTFNNRETELDYVKKLESQWKH